MKKFMTALLVVAVIASIAYARGSSNPKNTRKGQKIKIETKIKQEMQTREESKKKEVLEIKQVKAQNMAELKKMSIKIKMELEEENKKMRGPKKDVYKNQNRVRLAVHNLLAMENMLGGIGPQVSKIAREFNNSANKTIQAEIKIRGRGRFKRFFTGGDKESAEIIKRELSKEEEMIRTLEGLVKRARVAVEVKANIEEQINNIKGELERLANVVKGEEESPGVFSR